MKKIISYIIYNFFRFLKLRNRVILFCFDGDFIGDNIFYIIEKLKTEKIDYKFQVKGNSLILDNYFLTDVKNKFRGQEVDVYLYLPEGQLFKPDASVQDYDDSEDDFNLYKILSEGAKKQLSRS